MAGLTQCDWVIVASLLMSALITLGFLSAWLVGLETEYAHGRYLLYYALYLVTSNMPKLVLTIVDASARGGVWFLLDVAGLFWLLKAADRWNEGRRTPVHWIILATGVAIAMWYNATEADVAGLAMAGVTISVLVLTVYYISTDSPLVVTAITGLSFLSWIAITAVFVTTGDPVGHAFAMVVKVAVFGGLALAHYERAHRYLYEAAYLRKVAIEIYTGDITDIKQVEKNGPITRARRPGFSGPTAAYRTNG